MLPICALAHATAWLPGLLAGWLWGSPACWRPPLEATPFQPVPAVQQPDPQPIPQTTRGGADGTSLEAYLERVRAERVKLHARIAPGVERLLARVAASEEAPTPEMLAELVEFGSEATPLVVRSLDPEPPGTAIPGLEPSVGARRTADFVARAMPLMGPKPVVRELLALLENGSTSGRVRAARVLSAIPDIPEVERALRTAFDQSEGALQHCCLESLLTIGGPATEQLLGDVLVSALGEDTSAELVDLALAALARGDGAGSGPLVKRLFLSRDTARRHAEALVGFYRAHPDAVDDEVLTGLVAIALRARSTEQLLVLDALPSIASKLGTLRKQLKPLTEHRDGALRDAALTALARLGDRTSRRALLEPRDKEIDNNRDWSAAYQRRGDILRSIGDYDAAIRDYKKALGIDDGDPKAFEASHIGMARCYALRGRLRDAGDWLRRAPITLSELRALADDPDFAELRASKYGPEAFALEESR